MDITEISILHHVGIVLTVLWILSSFGCCHPLAYFVSLIYLYRIHERYVMRLRKKVQFDERRQANQKRVLSDSESVRWLNHAVEQVWPICMERIASQQILLPIIPWFLDKYKPWTAKKAVAQHLYLGRSPPVFTEIRAVRQSDDDHLILELGMNFLTADDMSATLAVKLRRRLGFGMWAKMHVTGMHIEGKVLVGVKFLREWPFIGRLRVCFVEPPYFQMTVKPIISHGFDVTELPGIAGWLDKLLAVAFEQTLVEPNMLVVDMEKFASASTENWFTVDEKDPIAHVKVEVIEAADMKPSDPNGLADPYVKGQLGPYRFRTKTQKKTLAPKWQEEFKIPICSWESPNVLAIEVRDKDHFVDDSLGDCSINIGDLRDGQRYDKWISLENIKMGRLHLAVTVLDADGKGEEDTIKQDFPTEESKNSVESDAPQEVADSTVTSVKVQKRADAFEPINVPGLQETGIWVHHPGSDVSQTWEPRKRLSRKADIQIRREDTDSAGSPHSAASASNRNVNSSSDENADGNSPRSLGRVRRSLNKIGSVFHRSPKGEDSSISGEVFPSPRVNLRAVNARGTSVKIIRDDDVSGNVNSSKVKENSSPERNETKGNMKGKAKNLLKQAEHGLKHVLTRKISRKGNSGSASTEVENDQGFDSSDEESQSSFNQNKHTVEGVPLNSPPVKVPDVEFPHTGGQTIHVSQADSERTLPRSAVGNISFKGREETASSPHVHYEIASLDSKMPEEISQDEKR